jgi:hypothetical protein
MSQKKRIAFVLLSLAGICVCTFAALHLKRNLSRRRAVHQAEEEIKQNYWALAFENLDPFRHDLIKNDQDCSTLLNVYFNLKKVDRLEWATQACLEYGVHTYEVYLNVAAVHELQGHDQDALQTLAQMTQQADQRFEAFQRMAAIYTRNHDEAHASEALSKAASRVDDPQMKLEAVQMALRQNRLEDIKTLAPAIRDVKTENPEVKLIVARALYKVNDITGAEDQVNQAKVLLDRVDVERKKKLEHDYIDVLKSNNPQAAR